MACFWGESGVKIFEPEILLPIADGSASAKMARGSRDGLEGKALTCDKRAGAFSFLALI